LEGKKGKTTYMYIFLRLALKKKIARIKTACKKHDNAPPFKTLRFFLYMLFFSDYFQKKIFLTRMPKEK